MANQEQLERLKQGVGAWNAWRAEHPNSELDLREADLIRADLQRADLIGADLARAKLAKASLYKANLTGANLEQANLIGTDLMDADLTRAGLREADLTGAVLMGTNFHEADLRETDLEWSMLLGCHLTEANLTGANLEGTTLRETDLTGANMRGVKMGWTIFGNIDLRMVQGLDDVHHLAPSTIGLDTIEQSHGHIPEIFLRGAGVAERIIEYLPSLTAQAINYYSCFISYSHVDTSFARRLHDALQGRGIRCWLDEHQLLPGHSIYDEVDRGIRLWDKILLCASEHSLKSWWVDHEIDKAFTKEQQLIKQRSSKVRALIPLNLDNALWQWQDGKADQVRSRLAADFTGWEHDNAKFEREFERLVKALRTDEGREEPPLSRL